MWSFDIREGKKTAKFLDCMINGAKAQIPLTEQDLVFITNGSCTEGTVYGDQDHKPDPKRQSEAEHCWNTLEKYSSTGYVLWNVRKNSAPTVKRPVGNQPQLLHRMRRSFLYKKIARRDPRTGKVVTGGIVSCQDSGWLLSWTVNRQGQFKAQKKEEVCIWLYGLFPNGVGNFVPKPMSECTGREITEEWLYHLGVPADQIHDLAAWGAVCVPAMMPILRPFSCPEERETARM